MSYLERIGVGAIVIFCDDIRQEIHNKHVLVGVYPGYELTVGTATFPVVIPKMGINVRYYEERDTFPTYKTIEAFMPGEEKPFFSAEMDEDDVKMSLAGATKDLPLCGFSLISLISPLVIPREGNLMVYARNERDQLRLGTLKIKADPNSIALPFG